MGLWVHGDKRLCISMQRLLIPIWARLLHRAITLWKLKISEAAYPRLAFSPVSSPPLLYGSHVTKLMWAVDALQLQFSTSAGTKVYSKGCRTSTTPVPPPPKVRPLPASMLKGQFSPNSKLHIFPLICSACGDYCFSKGIKGLLDWVENV